MKLLTSPKSMYLLDAGLDVLHSQTIEWMNEIAFWRDEAAFLYALVVKNTLKSIPVEGKETLEKIEKDLLSLTGGELDELQQIVAKHENFLGLLLENDYDGEESYREKHRVLTVQFHDLEKRFKNLKREIFEFVKLTHSK